MINRVRAIYQRECAAMFLTPLAWSAAALVGLAAGLAFVQTGLEPGVPATLGPMMRVLGWALLFTAPALALRATTEERRSGYWEVLVTGPATQIESAMARLLALAVACALLVAPSLLVGTLALETVSRPDIGEVGCGGVGLWLAGMAFASSALAAGALSTSSVVAYLAMVFGWLIVAGAARVLPAALDARYADWVFAADPFRRLDNFLVGILDTADVLYFVALIGLFVAISVAALKSEAERQSRWGFARVLAWTRPLLFATACLVIAVAVATLARAEPLRGTVDATKSRMYSLSPSTIGLLRSLQGEWSVTLLVDRSGADAVTVAQAEEVVRELSQAMSSDTLLPTAASLRARTIDAADPTQAEEFARWLEALESHSRPTVVQYEEVLDDSMESFIALRDFARAELPGLDLLSAALSEGTPDRRQVDALRSAYRQLLDAAEKFQASVRELRTSTGERPFADLAQAASVMAANDGYWSAQLGEVSSWFAGKISDSGAAGALRSAAGDMGRRSEAVAIDLRRVQDNLDRLPKLELAAVTRAIAAGDAAVIESPLGLAVVPGWQLLPRGGDEGDVVRFDRRFRGEQALAAAIRALVDPVTPRAVIVHSSATSIVRPVSAGSDLSGVVDALRLARWEVMEWMVGGGSSKPASSGAPTIWIIVQPTRATLELSEADRALIAATQTLIDDGEGVLLSVGPSLLPMAGRQDPWAQLADRVGARAHTDLLIIDEIPVSEGRTERRSASVSGAIAAAGGAIAAMLADQQFSFGNCVPIDGTALVEARPMPGRVMLADWRKLGETKETGTGEVLKSSVAVAVASENRRGGKTRARAIVVGSPDWLTSAHLSKSAFAGSREMLVAPGNRQLLLAASAWLAGLDDRVASVNAASDVPRVGAMSTGARMAWMGGSVLGMPLLLLFSGVIIWVRRNRR